MSTAERRAPWASLDQEAKRRRLLAAAGELFARDGLDAQMPAIAEAAGAGVGSVYRQFTSKEELICALVVERMAEVRDELHAALEGLDAWTALTSTLWRLLERHSCDHVMAEAVTASSDRPEVQRARREVAEAFEPLLARARDEGGLRADATQRDTRLLFVAARAAKQAEPGAWRRMVELLMDGLRAPGRPR
jgi:AcrR family transcriptional regulator